VQIPANALQGRARKLSSLLPLSCWLECKYYSWFLSSNLGLWSRNHALKAAKQRPYPCVEQKAFDDRFILTLREN
jgi:hypothetical protein